MSARERIKRPEPERTQPVRNWSTVFGAPPRNGPPGFGGSGRPAPTDPVSRGVEAGYRVVDEYLRQGQAVARAMWAPFLPGGTAGPFTAGNGAHAEGTQANGAAPPPFAGFPLPGFPTSPDEVQQRMGTMLRSATDLAMMWMDFVGLGAAQAQGARAAAGPFPTNGEPPAAAPSQPTQTDDREQTVVSVELTSRRRTEVSVDLRSASTGLPLRVHDLRSPEVEGKRLGGVGIQGFPAEDRVVVRVEVPDDLPAGTYSGVIVDELSSLPRGSLSVKIHAHLDGAASGPNPRAPSSP